MTLKCSEKLYHPFSHVYRFGNMFPESHGFVDKRLRVMSKINVLIYPYLISERRRNWRRNRHSNGTVTLGKDVIQNIKTCENRWSIFSEKFDSRADKIAQVNSINIKKSINLLTFCTVLRPDVMLIFLN